MRQITNAQARRYLMALHFQSRGNALMNHVRGLRSVQFDPLNVVGRNPDLVLQSRIKKYRPQMLYKALYEDRALIDGFDKNLCIFPIEDFPYFARIRREGYSSYYHSPEIRAFYPKIADEIRARGPLCSSDLDMDGKVDWPWGATTQARAALEAMWYEGGLILSHKKGTRRYYDLIEHHLPGEILHCPEPNPDDDDYYAWLMMRRIESVGMLWNRASDAFLCMHGFNAERRERAFAALIERRELLPVSVEGIDVPLYIPSRNEAVLEESFESGPERRMRFIAPLDNLIWDRRLIEALFGFYYRWEVYTPRDKREFGYYVLPVVWADRFVARFEPEHYRSGPLVIKNWWWEGKRKPNKALLSAREKCLGTFCAYLSADRWRIECEHFV